MFFFATNAYAQGAGGSPGEAAFNIVPIVLIVLVFYFFILRPQSKRAKEHKTFLEALKRGDKVVTASGIIGSVVAVDDTRGVVTLEIAKDTQVKFVKSQVSSYHKADEAAKS